MNKAPSTYHGPWFIMCEGPGDKSFYEYLLKAQGMAGDFDVWYPVSNPGRGGIAKGLTTLWETSQSFQSNVKGIVIVADNDENPVKSFKEVTQGLKREAIYGIPSKPGELATKDNLPAVAILMIPIGNTGCIESLCLPGAYKKWDLEAAVDTYVAASPAAGWGLVDQSKMRMSVLLSATCQPKPEGNFANHWQLDPAYHVPVDGPEFDEIVSFLKDFPALVAAA